MIRPRIKVVNARRGSRPPAPPAPLLTYDTVTGLWNIAWSGMAPAQWQEWEKCDYHTDWWKRGTLAPEDLPATTDAVLAGDEQWWQVKYVGLDGNGNAVTSFSNIVSSQ